MPAEVPKAEKPMDAFTDNTKKLAELKASFDPDNDDLEAYRTERSKLIQANETYSKAQEEAGADNEMFDAHTEASQMNKELDSAKAQAQEAERLKAEADARAKQAEQDQAARAEELKVAAALIERIKSGKVETRQGESVGAQGVSVERGRTEIPLGSKDEAIDERPIEERLEAPKTEMFEKYGSKMRAAADGVISVRRAMNSKDEVLGESELQLAERKKLRSELDALHEQRNALVDDAAWGSKVIDFRKQKSGEDWSEYHKYQMSQLRAYKEAAMSDSYTVLRLAEAGELGHGYRENEGIGTVNRKLRSNPEFMAKLLEALPSRTTAESFWPHVAGEARTRELFVAAIQKNHLNYQFGLQEWKTDPEIQKIAKESGLDPTYLQK